MTAVVHYGPHSGAKAVSDFELDKEMKNILDGVNSKSEIHFWYNTENIFTCIRLHIVRGVIPCEKVMFEFNGKQFFANRFGAIPKWPDGWCDTVVKMSHELISKAAAMRHAETRTTQPKPATLWCPHCDCEMPFEPDKDNALVCYGCGNRDGVK